MFLLDTNAVSESRKLATSNVDPVFKNWIDEIDPNLLYVSVISLMELEVGILRISRRDTRQGIALRECLIWNQTELLSRINFAWASLDGKKLVHVK